MIDVLGAVVGCVSAGTLVWFLERHIFRERKEPNREALLAAIEAKRAILLDEQSRFSRVTDGKGRVFEGNTRRILEINQELMKLADEKAKVLQ